VYGKIHFSTRLPTKTPKKVKHLIGKIIHIHSTLKNGLILGVDNTEQIKNKQLSENDDFVPRIVKREAIKLLGLNSAIEARKLINSSNIIIAFGLSIGSTDKYWWNFICNWLLKGNDRHFIIFLFNDKMNRILNTEKIKTIENCKNRLFSSLNSSLQKQYNSLSKRIHFISEQNEMFKIKNIFYPTKPTKKSRSCENWFKKIIHLCIHIIVDDTSEEEDKFILAAIFLLFFAFFIFGLIFFNREAIKSGIQIILKAFLFYFHQQ
jgi:hypothetical protein